MLSSHLPQGSRFAIIGASGAIGQAFLHGLREAFPNGELVALSRRPLSPQALPDNARWLPIDLESEGSIAQAAQEAANGSSLQGVIIASGLLHDGQSFQPEKSIKQLTVEKLQKSFLINAIGPALVGKHFLPCMPKRERSYFAALSARVGSISDNRVGGWHGYRASKAALNMFLKNLSIEGKRSHPELIVAGLQPGTVDSALSKPFQGSARHILEPSESVRGLLRALSGLSPEDSGTLIDWKGISFAP